MAEADPDKLAFARFATAVSPHLGQIVVAGGWAHRLYLLDDRAKPMGFPPLMTTDADVATSAGAGQIKPSINELLLAAGFVEELSGDGSEPTAKYTLPVLSQVSMQNSWCRCFEKYEIANPLRPRRFRV